jgi:lipoprotein-anchoring transpeptidase ErfK/SrfK
MRKLLVLLLAAAVVGVVISRARDTEGTEAGPKTSVDAAPTAAPEPAAEPAPPPPGPVVVERRAPEPAERVALSASAPAEQSRPEQPDEAPPKRADEETRKPDNAAVAALEEGVALLKQRRFNEARRVLTGLYLSSRGELARSVRDLLDYASRETILNPRNVEGARIHVVQAGETLSAIGKKYGVNWRMIQQLNGMSTDRLSVGQQLKVPAGVPSAVAVLSEFRMALLMDGLFVKEYGIGIGRDNLTPTGDFVVDSMLVRPRWYKPGGGIIEYGEEGHLLGERWIGFRDEPGATGLGIHGTNDEASIGTWCSNGCLRMRNEDVIEFYGFAREGMHVRVVQ